MSKRLNITSFIICLIFTASLFSISTTTVSAKPKPCHKRSGLSINPKVAKDGVGTACRKKEARQLALADYYKKNCDGKPDCKPVSKCKVWKKKKNKKVVVRTSVSCVGYAKDDGGDVNYTKIDDDACKPITGKAIKYQATATGRFICKCSCPYLSPDAPAC